MEKEIAVYKKTQALLRSDAMASRLREMMNQNDVGAFVNGVLTVIAGSEKLQACTPESIFTSVIRAATLRLSVDPSTPMAYLVPYGNRCTLIVGYRGLVNLAYRTMNYQYINADIVYQGEKFEADKLSGEVSFSGYPDGSGVILGYFAVFKTKRGITKGLFMSVDEINAHKERYAKGWKNPDSAWNTNFNDMARKTPLRLLLSRWGDFNTEDQRVMKQILEDDDPEDQSIKVDWIEQAIDDGVEKENKKEAELKSKSNNELLDELGFSPDSKPDKKPKNVDTEKPVKEERPWKPDVLKKMLLAKAETKPAVPSTEQVQAIAACLEYILKSKGGRYEFLSWVSDKPVKSSKDMDDNLLAALGAYLDPKYDKNGGVFYPKNENVTAEVTAAHTEYLKSIGQAELEEVSQ